MLRKGTEGLETALVLHNACDLMFSLFGVRSCVLELHSQHCNAINLVS